MGKRNDSPEPFYSYGAALIELGKAMQDKRTGVGELAVLAHDLDLRLQFRFVNAAKSAAEEPQP